jgi:hypothetical protein
MLKTIIANIGARKAPQNALIWDRKQLCMYVDRKMSIPYYTSLV